MKPIRCPKCGKATTFDPSNLFRPFCSERCQILDLGAWADEKYAFEGQELESTPVNKNQNLPGSDEEQFLNPPPKHQLN
jgi:endogenous inhibitor of DNA gyrase (YacG/DUF329 family)